MPDPRKVLVLVIDDEPMIRKSVGGYLEDSGYEVSVASDGEEGVAAFQHDEHDIVLTDMRMPKLAGLGVISAIRATPPSTPIIALSGTRDIVEEATRRGANLCLTKPILDLSDLVKAIEKLLA